MLECEKRNHGNSVGPGLLEAYPLQYARRSHPGLSNFSRLSKKAPARRCQSHGDQHDNNVDEGDLSGFPFILSEPGGNHASAICFVVRGSFTRSNFVLLLVYLESSESASYECMMSAEGAN